MPIQYVKGDATQPLGTGPRVICHCVNDIGKWGSGFVLAINERWPVVEALYRQWHRTGSTALVTNLDAEKGDLTSYFALGSVQIIEVEPSLWVANIIGQRKTIRDGEPVPIRYDALRRGFQCVATFCLTRVATTHMPRIGAGLAKGKWNRIEPILQSTLVDHGIPTTVYDLPVV